MHLATSRPLQLLDQHTLLSLPSVPLMYPTTSRPPPPLGQHILLSLPFAPLMYPAISRPLQPLDQPPTPSSPTMQLTRSTGPRWETSPPRVRPTTAWSLVSTLPTCTHVSLLSPDAALSLPTQLMESLPPCHLPLRLRA